MLTVHRLVCDGKACLLRSNIVGRQATLYGAAMASCVGLFTHNTFCLVCAMALSVVCLSLT